MRRLLTHWRLMAGVALVAALLVAALWPEAVEVDVVRVDQGPILVTVDEEGETRVRERFVVSAPVAGRLQRIELEPGDPVVRGRTVLARLMPAPPTLIDARMQAELTSAIEAARAALGQAQAERARSEAMVERARAALKRQQELAQAGLLPAEDLETSQTALRTAEEARRAADFSVRRAEFEIETAWARLQQSAPTGRPVEILSPIDGVVLKRFRESEAIVPGGEPLIEIGDASRLEIVSDLLSTDAVRVSAGQVVLLEQWGGSETLRGRVRRVEPSGFMKISALGVEEQRVNVIIDFEDAPAAGRVIGDGYRTEIRIVVAEEKNAVKAPVGSLFRAGDEWAAFVVDGELVRRQTLQLGLRNSLEAQIVSGLAAGAEIVLHPPDTLADGMRVVRAVIP